MKPTYVLWNESTGDYIRSYYTKAAAEKAAARLNQLAGREIYRVDLLHIA